MRRLIRDADDVTANNLVMPGLLANLTPPDQQGSNFAFNLETLESGIASDEWMAMVLYRTWYLSNNLWLHIIQVRVKVSSGLRNTSFLDQKVS